MLIGLDPVNDVKEVWKDVTAFGMIKNNLKSFKKYFINIRNLHPGFEKISSLKTFKVKFVASIYRYFNYFFTELFILYE